MHEGFHRLALETIQFTKAYLSDWDRVNNKILKQRIEEEQWRPPNFSKVKINFDTAFEKQLNITGTDIVCQDLDGLFWGPKQWLICIFQLCLRLRRWLVCRQFRQG